MAFSFRTWLSPVAAGAGTALVAAALTVAPAWGQGVIVGGGGGGAIGGGAMGGGGAIRGGGGGGAAFRGGGMPAVRTAPATRAAAGGDVMVRGGAGAMQPGAEADARARGAIRGGDLGQAEMRGGIGAEVRQEARGMIDEVRGRGLDSLEMRRGEDSFQEAMRTGREQFRQSGDTAREGFRDALTQTRDQRAGDRDTARQLEDRQQAWRDAQGAFQDTTREARMQFHDGMRDARGDFRDARQQAHELLPARPQQPAAMHTDDRFSGTVTAQREDRRLEEAPRGDTRDAANILRDRGQPSAGIRAGEWELSQHYYPLGRGTEGGLSQSLSELESRGVEVQVPAAPQNRPLPASTLDRFELPRQEFRPSLEVGAAQTLQVQSGTGRIVAPVPSEDVPDPRLSGIVRGVQARAFDPSEVGRDVNPVFQRAYAGLEQPFASPPAPTPPPPPTGFPPPNVPPDAPPPSGPAPAIPSVADLGLVLDPAALAAGTLTVQSATGIFSDLGLLPGDTLLALNGVRLTSETQLLNNVFHPLLLDAQMTLEILRGGQFVDFAFVPAQTFRDFLP